jgi:hypothetical protein
MENAEEIRDWVAQQTAYLDPPAEWQPDPAAALLRFHARRRANLWPKRRYWPVLAAAAVVAAGVFLALPAGRVRAQQLWQFLTVRQVAFIRVAPWPDGVPSPAVSLIGVPIPPIPARDAAEAGARVHYDPRLPNPFAIGGSPKLSTTFSMAAGTVVKVADLQLALQKAGITDQTVPAQWDGAQVSLHTSPMVIAEWPDITLVQSQPLTLTAPSNFDFAAYSTLILRVLGVGPDQARQLAAQMGTAPPWLAPVSRDFRSLDSIEQVTLNSGPATLAQAWDSNASGQHLVLCWSVPDRVYLLNGYTSRQLAITIANAVR